MVREAGLATHVKCFVHMLNLATAVLERKEHLNKDVNEHKLIMDVTTCWDSSLDIVKHYLKQQPPFDLCNCLQVSLSFLLKNKS